jgi:regulator of replication initiation timing
MLKSKLMTEINQLRTQNKNLKAKFQKMREENRRLRVEVEKLKATMAGEEPAT